MTDLLSTDRTWYHGTSTDADLDDGDYLDPSRGSYEPCVWVTSCPKVALGYAQDRAALGGNPVVYAVKILDGSVVADLDDSGADFVESIEAAAAAGVEIAVIRKGEHGVPMAAVLGGSAMYIDHSVH